MKNDITDPDRDYLSTIIDLSQRIIKFSEDTSNE